MDARVADLFKKLTDHGWQVVNRERDPEWWAAEIWTVESVWSPPGFTLYVTWLRDPMDERTLWAVGASTQRPTDRFEAANPVCASLRHWPRGVPEFLDALATLRSDHLRIST